MTKIVYAPFPYLDEDRTKDRPLLVLAQNKDQNDTIIVAYITSKSYKNLLESDFSLVQSDEIFAQTGLEKDSLIRLHKLGCIQKSSIKYEIGTLPSSTTLQIKSKLKKIFNL